MVVVVVVVILLLLVVVVVVVVVIYKCFILRIFIIFLSLQNSRKLQFHFLTNYLKAKLYGMGIRPYLNVMSQVSSDLQYKIYS